MQTEWLTVQTLFSRNSRKGVCTVCSDHCGCFTQSQERLCYGTNLKVRYFLTVTVAVRPSNDKTCLCPMQATKALSDIIVSCLTEQTLINKTSPINTSDKLDY